MAFNNLVLLLDHAHLASLVVILRKLKMEAIFHEKVSITLVKVLIRMNNLKTFCSLVKELVNQYRSEVNKLPVLSSVLIC